MDLPHATLPETVSQSRVTRNHVASPMFAHLAERQGHSERRTYAVTGSIVPAYLSWRKSHSLINAMQGIFEDNVTGGEGHGRGFMRCTQGSRLPNRHEVYVCTVEHQIFIVHASDLATLSSVYM